MNDLGRLGDTLTFLLSIVVLAAIGIIVSGQLLTPVFNLSRDGDDFFNLHIPKVFKARLTGRQVTAAFGSYVVSVLGVGAFWSNLAHDIFVVNMQATTNQWQASVAMASSISVVSSMVFGGAKLLYDTVIAHRKQQRLQSPAQSDEDRVKRLTGNG